MKLQDIRILVQNSTPEDWHRINTSGSDGPSFHNRIRGEIINGDPNRLEVYADTHDYLFVNKNDVRLSIESGMNTEDDPTQQYKQVYSWVHKSWDEETHGKFLIDIFWEGNLVDRIYYTIVDGARAMLPMPYYLLVNFLELGDQPYVEPYDVNIVSLVHTLEDGDKAEFEHCFDQAGFITRERNDEE